MDLSAGRRAALTTEERQRCMREGRCLYYGGVGHTLRVCPNRPLRASEATVTTEPPGNPVAVATGPDAPRVLEN